VSLAIKARLTIWYVALLALILAAFSAFVFLRLRADLVKATDQSLGTRAAQISLGYRGPGRSNFQDVSDVSYGGTAPGESAAQIISSAGIVQDSAGDPAVAEVPMLPPRSLELVAAGGRVTETRALGGDAEPFRVLAVELPTTSGRSSVLAVATSLEEVGASVHRLLVLILAGIPAALAAAGLGGWLLATKALGPVARMTGAAERIGGGRFHERITVPPSSDELRRLALTLNAMLDRLQQSVDGQRRFVADASHDLRTPLTVMRAEIELALDEERVGPAARTVLVSNRDEVDRMMRMVENMLTLASIEDGRLELLVAPVELTAIVWTAVRQLRPLASTRGVRVSVEGGDVSVPGDRERLTQVVTNLVENAVKYSRPQTCVRIAVWSQAGEAGFTVSDSGPGIPQEALTRVFDRFSRLDVVRSSANEGSGLGLAICRDVVEAHGGRIWVESSLGTGSAFWVALPTT
jgi:heavy metal sensor kinase